MATKTVIAQRTEINNNNDEYRNRMWDWLTCVFRIQKKRCMISAFKISAFKIPAFKTAFKISTFEMIAFEMIAFKITAFKIPTFKISARFFALPYTTEALVATLSALSLPLIPAWLGTNMKVIHYSPHLSTDSNQCLQTQPDNPPEHTHSITEITSVRATSNYAITFVSAIVAKFMLIVVTEKSHTFHP